MAQASVAALRKYIRPREAEERCDFCGVAIRPQHPHHFDPPSHRIRCACQRCSESASAGSQIPSRIVILKNFAITDPQWDDLLIPISLAFFSFSTPAQRVIAQYPGAAGAAESLLRLDAWQEICDVNPELRNLRPDVEALLVNRVGTARQYFIVPIDECYKLVGLIRIHWRGLSGGAIVWGEIARFFESLQQKAAQCQA